MAGRDDGIGDVTRERHRRTDQQFCEGPATTGGNRRRQGRAVKAWLGMVGSDGPLFRAINKGGRIGTERLSDKTVALVVKRAAEAAGLDAAAYAGHSLRSGFATTAARNGASEAAIMRQTGHKSVQVVRGYIRHGELFRDTAAAKLGL